MNKNIKTIIKIIVTILIALTVLLILPKEESALTHKEIENLIDGDVIYCGVSQLSDRSIYCIEKGQNLASYFQVRAKYEVKDNSLKRTLLNGGIPGWKQEVTATDKNSVNFAKGLIYIFSKIDDNNYTRNGDVQLALWEYIRLAYTQNWEGIQLFHFQEQNYDVHVEDWKNVYGKDKPYYVLVSSARASRKAWEIYQTAYDIYEGEIPFYCDDTIYKMIDVNVYNGVVTGINGSDQELFLVDKIDIKPKVNLVINKEDSLTGKKLSDVDFKIELTNVEAILGYSVANSGDKTTITKATNKDGQISLKGIMPEQLGTEIKVKITEEIPPTTDGTYFYKPADPIEFTLKYEDGAWKKRRHKGFK